MNVKPLGRIVNQAFPGTYSEELSSRNAIDVIAAGNGPEPALHKLPTEFVGKLEMLNDPGANSDPLRVAEPVITIGVA